MSEDERSTLTDSAPDVTAPKTVEVRLRPTAAVILDGPDEWLEARVLAKAASGVSDVNKSR
jgi:hypothetical protein